MESKKLPREYFERQFKPLNLNNLDNAPLIPYDKFCEIMSRNREPIPEAKSEPTRSWLEELSVGPYPEFIFKLKDKDNEI